jgi:hypothetical protein
MSGRLREWLPLNAATGPRVRDALEGAVDTWSRTWFAGARGLLTSVAPHPSGAPEAAGGWLLYDDIVAVPADGPDAIRLAGLALGVAPESLVLSEPDRDIIGRLAATILADLAAALAASLERPPSGGAAPTPTADPLEGDAGIVLRVADASGRTLAQAALPLAALVPFLKARIPARPAPDLPHLDGPVGRTLTRLDIRLGDTRLSLGDLTGLAAGDVLVLDREIEAGARVALGSAHGQPFARGAFETDRGTTRLTLAHEIRDA